MEINDILQAFEIYDREYKRSAIDAAIARRVAAQHFIRWPMRY